MADKPWAGRSSGSVRDHRLIATLAVASGVSSLLVLTGCAPIMSLAGSSGSGLFLATHGAINGTMAIKRDPAGAPCSIAGVMDTNDPYLDALYGSRLVKEAAAR
jgi:hypothetical protein